MKRLEVYLKFGENLEIPVGELAEQAHRIYFQYHNSFLEDPLWLSPYKLPPASGLQEHKERGFGPLFGLFDDSLPDGWGLMLMDRFLRGKGYTIAELSVLDRLSFLGSSTMGALCYRPTREDIPESSRTINLHNLYSQSGKILRGETQTVLKELMLAGGSPGGARPKVLVGVKDEQLISGEGDLPAEFEHWMIKFAGSDDYKDAGPVEYAYSLMAGDCGIIMPETRLFDTDKGERFFGIKRFDRDNNNRFHTHTLGNLIHSNFRIPSCDYEMLFRVTLDLTKKHKEVEQAFRRMIFNIYAHNRDDHVKNFTFLMDHRGEWFLAPAYDLTFSSGPGGEHSMTVNGEGRSPSSEDIFRLGEQSGLKKGDITGMMEEVSQTVARWRDYAEEAGVSGKTKKAIAEKVDVHTSL